MKEGLDFKPERWPDVNRVFSAAAPLDGPSRKTYLNEACGQDGALRAAVESLLRAHDNAGSFGDAPVVASLTKRLAPESQLGPFRIESLLGAGSMGEVYRAYDTKLQRAVAIKVLPDFFAQDPVRLARFEEEARALAALNHPHVGAIYGLEESAGIVALVLELVEGLTLADRLADGPLSFDEVVGIARQLAEGLEAAHENRIVHRDLKPANIKITPDGNVKILDFGLSKTAASAAATATESSSAVHPGATQVGTVLGTVGYMSPEQARGLAVDKRTDIWAFGCVLFEMCAHQPPFAGATISDAQAAVIDREPDWGLLRADTPRNLIRLLRRCLTKDPKLRLRDIGEARIALEHDRNESDSAPRLGRGRVVAVTGILATAAGAAITFALFGSPPAAVVTRLDVALPPGDVFQFLETGTGGPVLTSDGRTLFYVAERGGNQYVFRRELKKTDTEIVSGTEGAVRAYMYPTGDWLAFSTSREGLLKKVPLSGGPPTAVYQSKGRIGILGLDFISADEMVVGDHGYGLFSVPAAGGEPVSLLPVSKEGPPRFPVALPGGRGLLFTVGGVPISNRIAVLPKGASSMKFLTGGTDARYLNTGHIVFWRDGSLWAAPFDLDRLELSGDAVPVVHRVGVFGTGAGLFDVSASGTLAYVSTVEPPARTLVWVDRDGRETALDAPPGPYMEPRLSPDEQKVLLSYRDFATEDIWLHDITRKTTEPFAAEPFSEFFSFWSRNGERVLFTSRRSGNFRIYSKRVSGLGGAERIGSDIPHPLSLTPDGKAMLFHDVTGPRASRSVSTSPIAGGPPTVLWTEENNIADARFSPDGKWIAYSVGSTPAEEQIWLRPYPIVPAAGWRVSPEGGRVPRWSSDSRTIFYRRGPDMMAAKMGEGPGGAPGTPKQLFSGPYQPDFDIASDGRFLMIKEPASQRHENRIIVVLNWIQELKTLVDKR